MSERVYLGMDVHARMDCDDDLILTQGSDTIVLNAAAQANLAEFLRLTSEPDTVVTPAEAKA